MLYILEFFWTHITLVTAVSDFQIHPRQTFFEHVLRFTLLTASSLTRSLTVNFKKFIRVVI
jgi:hypothetical protein